MRKKQITNKNKQINKSLRIIYGLSLVLLVLTIVIINLIKTENDSVYKDLPKLEDLYNYTLDEYQELTPNEKALIPDLFDNEEQYDDWYDSLKKNAEKKYHIDALEKGDKKAEDYTWEDYQNLSSDEKMLFPDYFDTFEDYQLWYENVRDKNMQ